LDLTIFNAGVARAAVPEPHQKDNSSAGTASKREQQSRDRIKKTTIFRI
jgi:hypothetical protein